VLLREVLLSNYVM